jgi:RNAse (barnase) inhibitor barstar
MTGLRALLTGPASAGVYRVGADVAPATIERVAVAAGWRVGVVDTEGLVDKRAVLGAFGDALGFPDWFGHNLDALVDALRDVDHEPGTVVLWRHGGALTAADPALHRQVVDILRSRAAADQPARLLTLLAD